MAKPAIAEAIRQMPMSMASTRRGSEVFLRELVIGLTAFLTVVDLFATQAILPSLARHYHVSPAAMGFAVNASTMGMAVSGLLVSLFSRRIDRRLGILLSLATGTPPASGIERGCHRLQQGARRPGIVCEDRDLLIEGARGLQEYRSRYRPI